MVLADSAIYEYARQAGFPADVAAQMVAIALRESGGNTMAHNSTPPDDSYGLWQINMYGSLRGARLALFGLSDPSQLYDPAVNAAAAFRLYAGNPANLAIAWAINKSGPPYYYAEKYQAFLPRAMAAAASSPLGSDVILASGGGGSTATGSDGAAAESPPGFLSASPPIAPVGRQHPPAVPVALALGGTLSLTPLRRLWRWLLGLLRMRF